MTTTYQISDKVGDKIVLIKSESDEPEVAWTDFGQALSALGEGTAQNVLAAMRRSIGGQVISTVADPLAAAVATVQANGFPQAQPVQQYAPQPQAPAYAPPAPQVPAAAAPVCQHGTKTLVQGSKNGRDWKAWGCPARRDDPTKCGLDFIRG